MDHENTVFPLLHSLREDVQYEEATFPISARYSGMADQKLPINEFPAHWHDDFEGVEYLQGASEYTVNGETFRPKQGDILFLKGNALHSIRTVQGSEARILLIHPRLFNPKELFMQKYLQMIERYEKNAWLIDGSQAWHEAFKDAFHHVYHSCIDREPCYEITASAQAFRMLELLVSDIRNQNALVSRDVFPKSSIEAMKRMLNFIHTEYLNDFSVADIAEAANISNSSCDKIFRRMLNKSPLEYVIDYRLDRSIELLAQKATVTEAAFGCGFRSLPYYSRMFRKKTGYPPSKYQKMIL